MAANPQSFILAPALRSGTFVQQVVVPANNWSLVQIKINSTDWNTTDGLSIAYSARKSLDGGVSWIDWGGFTATSPTFMKDGVTKVEPGGIWPWAGENCLLEVTVSVPSAFTWGATVTVS